MAVINEKFCRKSVVSVLFWEIKCIQQNEYECSQQNECEQVCAIFQRFNQWIQLVHFMLQYFARMTQNAAVQHNTTLHATQLRRSDTMVRLCTCRSRYVPVDLYWTSPLWLQMSWRQISARPSTTMMLSGLRESTVTICCGMYRISQHIVVPVQPPNKPHSRMFKRSVTH